MKKVDGESGPERPMVIELLVDGRALAASAAPNMPAATRRQDLRRGLRLLWLAVRP